MLFALRQLRARPTRSLLTIAGIAIGIVALVVVGALAEQLQRIVGSSTTLGGGTIFAVARGSDLARGDAGLRVARAVAVIRGIAGVSAVVPEAIVPYGSGGGDRFGPPSLVFGIPLGARKYAAGLLHVQRGRELDARDVRAAVVGGDFATAHHATIGTTLAVAGNSFHVVGIFAPSFTVFDAAVLVPYESARPLLRQFVAPDAPAPVNPPASAVMVVTAPHADSAAVARVIRFRTGLEARDPHEVAAAAAASTRVFDAIVFGAALIAVVVGTLSIVNTMTTAVAERTREVGVRKAVGASDAAIAGEFLAEAALIGAGGAAIGIALAAGIVWYLAARERAAGDLVLFALSWRLVAGAFAFGVLVSALAGVIPAIRAARLTPAVALRART